MSQTATLQIKLDPQFKQDASDLFSSMGLTTADAVKLFLKQSLNRNAIPFDIQPSPSYVTPDDIQDINNARINIKKGEFVELTPDMKVEDFLAKARHSRRR
jgi:addiction module RelB/DinJ family antitoxin